jgi:hypothetical protein
MKKWIALALAIICVLAMASCGKSESGDYPAMIMVNGIIYYSTDNAVPVEVDESVIQYTTSYAENGIPQKDGEANFNRDLGTPYAVIEGNRVVVLIDNEWIEFKAKEEQPVNTHTLEVTENSVGEIGRETFNLSVEISEEDANTLSAIINGGTWIGELTQCESDCVINLKGHWAHYNSESGILNKYNVKDLSVYSSKVQEVSGKSLVLSEEDRITVNAILEKYITLGFDSN